MDNVENIILPPRAGHARFVCEVNCDGSQQQKPTEVIQCNNNATLNTVGIPSL